MWYNKSSVLLRWLKYLWAASEAELLLADVQLSRSDYSFTEYRLIQKFLGSYAFHNLYISEQKKI